MQRKYTLNAFSVGDSAHGECFVESPALTANHNASEYLDSFLVPFNDTGVDPHAVPNGKQRHVTFVLFLLNGVDDLIHEKLPLPARRAGEQFPAGKAKLQPPSG